MSWPEALLALLVSHVAGDVLLQTDWQARTKQRGLRDAAGRRALARHVGTYTLAFVPAISWIWIEEDLVHALLVVLVVMITHVIIDDGRLVSIWTRKVKRAAEPALALTIAVDQSFHIVCLLGAALLVTI